jgi:hypothetical protein
MQTLQLTGFGAGAAFLLLGELFDSGTLIFPEAPHFPSNSSSVLSFCDCPHFSSTSLGKACITMRFQEVG